MADQSGQLQVPPSAQKPSGSEPVIHVMPAEFRGGKTPMTQPKAPVAPPKPVAPAPTPAPLPPPPKPVAPVAKPTVPAKKKPLVSPVLVIVGVIFLVVLAGAAYFLLNPSTPPATNVVVNNTPVVNTPPVNTPPANTPPTPVVTVPQPGKDSDSDGLTDVEEQLYGSDPHNPDTDGDSYLDGNEVFHMYNPNGNAPSNLADAGYVRPFSQTGFDYTMYYPSQWTVQLVGGVSEQAIFHAVTGETIQVSKATKTAEPTNGTATTTRQGYAGFLSADKMTTYLEVGTDVYVIEYKLAAATQINYLTTYQMMVNTFKVVAPKP